MRKKAAFKNQVPARLAFLGPSPLIDGEDSNAYDELLARVSGEVKPSDIFEEIWVSDIVDLTWEIFRLRRFKASFLTVAMSDGVRKVLLPLLSYRKLQRLPDEDSSQEQEVSEEQEALGKQEHGDEFVAQDALEAQQEPDMPSFVSGSYDAQHFSEGWAARDQDAIEKARATITSAGLTMDAVMAQTLMANIENVDRIHRMILSAGERRDAVLREIDRHRATLAERLRRATKDIEDADFRVVSTEKDQVRTAA